MVEFQYLKVSANGASIEGTYPYDDLLKKVIFRNEKTNKFIVFDARDDFLDYYRKMEDKHLHEVIIGNQHFKLDIETEDLISEKDMDEFMNNLIDITIEVLESSYLDIDPIYIDRKDLLVYSSCGPTDLDKFKWSYHLVYFTKAMIDNREVAELTLRIVEQVKEQLHETKSKYIDIGVNKSIQNFRFINSCKVGSKRIKTLTGKFNTFNEKDLWLIHFVKANIGTYILKSIIESKSVGNSSMGNINMDNATISIAKNYGITLGFIYRNMNGTIMNFNRTKPSMCNICERIHDNENSLRLNIRGDSIVEYCRLNKGGFKIIQKGSTNLNSNEKLLNYIKEINENPNKNNEECYFNKLEDKLIYNKNEMLDYDLKPTLAIKAGMGLGKTKALDRFLKKHFPLSQIDPQIIRFITFRQTFGNAINLLFPDFTLYSNIKGGITTYQHPRVIIQTESVHNLIMDEPAIPIDLLILDECESTLAQFNSGLSKHPQVAFAMFQWMIKTAKYVICMDANLSNRTYNTLIRMRSNYPISFHCNNYKTDINKTYYISCEKNKWLIKLFENIELNLNIVIPINSIEEAKAIKTSICERYPHKNVLIYNSETAPSYKKLHFGDVSTYWKDADILIYTPTCSAGVSFELKHYDILFGYFTHLSCDVETCRQMLGRVRDISTKEYHIYLSSQKQYLLTDTELIKKQIYDKRLGLYRTMTDISFQLEYNDDGSIKNYESDFFYLWLENIRMSNLSKNNFDRRFIEQIANCGGILAVYQNVNQEESLPNLKTIKEQLKEQYATIIVNAKDIDCSDMELIKSKMQNQQDITLEEKSSYDRYKLLEVYELFDKPREILDLKFVLNYDDKNIIRIYKNLCRITACNTLLESLQQIQISELSRFSINSNECRDLIRDKVSYVYNSHYIAILLLQSCGFIHIDDLNTIVDNILSKNLKSKLEQIKLKSNQIIYEFEISPPNFDLLEKQDNILFIKNILSFINKILRYMYGIQVSKIPSKINIKYNITQTNNGKLLKELKELKRN